MSKETKLYKLFELLRKIPSQKRPNFVLTFDNQVLFCHKERLNLSEYAEGHGFVKSMRPERGDVMSFFADLELIVNQILVSLVVVQNEDIESKFEQILDFVDFFSKVRVLNDWNIINNPTKEKLMSLKEVRNGFAHKWNIDDIQYKGRPVLVNFGQFKEDAEGIFNILIVIYNGSDINIDELLKKYE